MDAHAVDLVGVEDAAHEEEAEALPEVMAHQLVQVVRVAREVAVDGVAGAALVLPLGPHLVITTAESFLIIFTMIAFPIELQLLKYFSS